ncbi:hypothetical protein HYS94_01915 [Candidatus Daviesbacteria bacterium]|nr:hypothetical protein [Candidatus Daviesbacteria bacterium]
MITEKIVSIRELVPKRATKIPEVFDIQTSGGGTFILNGIIVHNSDVEFGKPVRPITETQEVFVRRFKRKDGVIVKAHTKKYINKRLIGFRPKLSKFERGEKIFRVISEEKEQTGQHYLGRAFQKEIKELPKDIEFFLRELERK